MSSTGTAQAVIFDMDGVLIDSEPLHLVTTNDVLGQWGHVLTAEENETYLGWNEPRYWPALKAKYDLDSHEAKQYLPLDKLREAMFMVMKPPKECATITGLRPSSNRPACSQTAICSALNLSMS